MHFFGVSFLFCLGAIALGLGLSYRRPALAILGATLVASHALPLLSESTGPHHGTVLMITATSSLGWCIGYGLLALKPDTAVRIPTITPAPPRTLHALLLLATLALVAAAPGGPVGFATSGFLRLPVETSLFTLTYVAACATAFTTTLVLVHTVTARSRPPIASMTLILLIFWLMGGRIQFAITALSFALVYLGYRRATRSLLALAAISVLLLTGFTLAFRLTLQGQETDLSGALQLMASQVSLLDGYALSSRFVEDFGHQPSHYFATLQQLLPRGLFPEKPPQLSRALRLMASRDMLGGLTPGLLGEAFVVGGHAFVALVSVTLGGVLAHLDTAWKNLPSHPPLTQALFVCLIPLLAVFTLRGGFDTSIYRLALLFLVAALVAILPARTADPALSRP